MRIGDGEIVAEIEGQEQYWYLDNLVRVLSSNDKKLWEQLITEHFDKLKVNKPAYDYFFKDFEHASQYLRVLIKDEDFLSGLEFNVSDFIYRIDFPFTKSFLIFEFDNKFTYIKHTDIVEWNKSIETLFEVAISNTPSDEITIEEYEFANKFDVFLFLSGDYSATLTLDLKNRADFGIGTYGSLIAIPTKGTAYVHPIETDDILELIEAIDSSVSTFFNEDPGNITTNYYWGYNDNFQVFPKENDVISLPNDLKRLFECEKH